jgi:hypothetical protein
MTVFRLTMLDSLSDYRKPPSPQLVTLRPQDYFSFVIERPLNCNSSSWSDSDFEEFSIFRARWVGFDNFLVKPRVCDGALFRRLDPSAYEDDFRNYVGVAECVVEPES